MARFQYQVLAEPLVTLTPLTWLSTYPERIQPRSIRSPWFNPQSLVPLPPVVVSTPLNFTNYIPYFPRLVRMDLNYTVKPIVTPNSTPTIALSWYPNYPVSLNKVSRVYPILTPFVPFVPTVIPPNPSYVEASLQYFREYLLDLKGIRQISVLTLPETIVLTDDSVQYYRQYLGRI